MNKANALKDIAAERRRQIEVEGWDTGHDDEHDEGQMADAAAAYAMTERSREMRCQESGPGTILNWVWPWDRQWWKPKDRRRDLVPRARREHERRQDLAEAGIVVDVAPLRQCP